MKCEKCFLFLLLHHQVCSSPYIFYTFFSSLLLLFFLNWRSLHWQIKKIWSTQSRTAAHHGAVKQKKVQKNQQTTAMFLFSITKKSICFCVVRKWSFPWTRMPGILIKKSVGTPKQKKRWWLSKNCWSNSFYTQQGGTTGILWSLEFFKTNGTWFFLSELGIYCRFLNVEFFHSFAMCISNSHNILPNGYQLYVPIAHQAFPCTYFTSTVSYCIVVKVGTMLNASYELQYTY